MDESLKALRLTHRTLLALLVAVSLFALSPNRHATYQHAYAFLDQLEAVDSREYGSWAQSIADQYLVSRHDFLDALFRRVAANDGPTVQWDHIDNGTITQALTFSQTGPRIADGTLEAINRDFREDMPVTKPILPVGRLASLVLNDIDPDQSYRLDDLAIRGTAINGRMDVQLHLYDGTGKHHHVYGIETFERSPIDGRSLRTWLSETGQDHLLAEPDETGVVFEPLRPVWPFVYTRSIRDAKDWLQQELLRLGDAKILSVFGISISEFQAGIAAPIITFALLFVLGVQLRHAIRLARDERDGTIQTFPWIPMFPGITGVSARAITLVLAPVAANAWLLARAEGTIALWGWVELVLVLGAAGWAFVEAGRLARSRSSAA